MLRLALRGQRFQREHLLMLKLGDPLFTGRNDRVVARRRVLDLGLDTANATLRPSPSTTPGPSRSTTDASGRRGLRPKRAVGDLRRRHSHRGGPTSRCGRLHPEQPAPAWFTLSRSVSDTRPVRVEMVVCVCFLLSCFRHGLLSRPHRRPKVPSCGAAHRRGTGSPVKVCSTRMDQAGMLTGYRTEGLSLSALEMNGILSLTMLWGLSDIAKTGPTCFP